MAAAARLVTPDWDGGIAAHPDERYLLGVPQQVPLWGDPCTAAPDFPYGHLPLYAARLLVIAAPATDPLFAARLLSGLLGVVLVALAGAAGRRVAGPRGGLLAAGLLALAPFAIQQAHFYTVDPWAAVLASGAVLAAMRRRWDAAGACAGLALASKASLVWVGLPLAWAALAAHAEFRRPATWLGRDARRALWRLARSALAAFALVSPWALLRPVACWNGPLVQAAMVSGQFTVPYTLQYAGTTPYLYPLAQMALWGLGPLATLLGLVGLGVAGARWRVLPAPARMAWIWCASFFLATGALYVKFPRYLLPLYPWWCAWAAWLLLKGTSFPADISRGGLRFGAAMALISSGLLGAAQISLYGPPHPWIAASRWIYANLLPGEVVAVERWDHPLPVPLTEGDPGAYAVLEVPIFAEESREKVARLQAARLEAQVVVLASRRGYGTLSRLPERYPRTPAWYRVLLTEREVRAFGRCPRLGPVALSDDPLRDAGLPASLSLAERCGTPYALRLPRLDESFRVYDAPAVVLLLK